MWERQTLTGSLSPENALLCPRNTTGGSLPALLSVRRRPSLPWGMSFSWDPDNDHSTDGRPGPSYLWPW